MEVTMKVEWVKMSSIRDNFLYFTLVLQTEKKNPTRQI